MPILLDQNVTINDKIRFLFRLFAGVLTKSAFMMISEFREQKCARVNI